MMTDLQERYVFGWRGYTPVVEAIVRRLIDRAVMDGMASAAAGELERDAMNAWVKLAALQEKELEETNNG